MLGIAGRGQGARGRGSLGPVNQQQITRKLTAILAADVAGYSRLMGAD